jgi:amino acid permease
MPVYSELVNPNFRRIKKVIFRSMITNMVFYMIIAVSGYMSTFNATNSVVVERYPLDGHDKDYFMLVGAMGIILIMVASLPVNYHPWRYQVFLLCFKRSDFSNKENVVITALFYTFTTLMAAVFPSITMVLTILGGLCSCTMSYLIPTWAYIKTSDEKWYTCKNLFTIFFFGTLTTIGYISVAMTVYQMITGQSTIGNRTDLIGD